MEMIAWVADGDVMDGEVSGQFGARSGRNDVSATYSPRHVPVSRSFPLTMDVNRTTSNSNVDREQRQDTQKIIETSHFRRLASFAHSSKQPTLASFHRSATSLPSPHERPISMFILATHSNSSNCGSHPPWGIPRASHVPSPGSNFIILPHPAPSS